MSRVKFLSRHLAVWSQHFFSTSFLYPHCTKKNLLRNPFTCIFERMLNAFLQYRYFLHYITPGLELIEGKMSTCDTSHVGILHFPSFLDTVFCSNDTSITSLNLFLTWRREKERSGTQQPDKKRRASQKQWSRRPDRGDLQASLHFHQGPPQRRSRPSLRKHEFRKLTRDRLVSFLTNDRQQITPPFSFFFRLFVCLDETVNLPIAYKVSVFKLFFLSLNQFS